MKQNYHKDLSNHLDIRIAKYGDLPAIVDIYNQAIPSYTSTARTEPVTVDERKGWFQEHNPQSHPIFVAELDEIHQ